MLRSFILFAGLVLALGLAGCPQQAEEPAGEVDVVVEEDQDAAEWNTDPLRLRRIQRTNCGRSERLPRAGKQCAYSCLLAANLQRRSWSLGSGRRSIQEGVPQDRPENRGLDR